MRIIFKHIIKNLLEKKIYTLLIILSIVVSSSMFFASITISKTLVKIQTDQWRSIYGYSDIIVTADKNSPTQFFYMNGVEKYSRNMEYLIGVISGYATYNSKENKKVGIKLQGVDINEIQKLTPINYVKISDKYNFKGMKIIISKDASEKYGLNIGDTMVLIINGTRHKFIISGIAKKSGPFSNEGEVLNALLPKEQLSSIYNARGKVDTIYIKLNNPMAKPMIKYKLSQEYEKFVVKEPFNKIEVERQSNSIATPILIVTVLLSFMTIYIIYSTFKIITYERMSAIGTFRSIGARKAITDFILLLESVSYGIFGGLIGCLAGVGILNITAKLLIRQEFVTITNIEFNYTDLLITFLLAILLSFISSIIPIIKVSSIPIKDIVLNNVQGKHSKRVANFIVGVILLSLAVCFTYLVPDNTGLWIHIICILMSFMSFVLLVPLFVNFFSIVLEKIYFYVFGNEGIIATKNVRDNKNIINNISLLVIGISFLFIVATVNLSQINGISFYFGRYSYDIVMSMSNANKNILNVLSDSDGVKDIIGSFSYNGAQIIGKDSNIWLLQGIDTTKFFDFYDIDTAENKQNIIHELDNDRNILLTNSLRNKIDVKKGDILTLRFYLQNGFKCERNYKIVGFFEDILQGGGSYALISQKNFKQDIGGSYYNPIYIKTSRNTVDVVNQLNSVFARQKPVFNTVNDMEKEARDSSKQTFVILIAFSVITMVIGFFGVLNNLIISFIQRRRIFAMYRSIGMSKVQIVKMTFIEALTGGIIGGLLGISLGAINLSLIIPNIMNSLNIFSHIYYSWPIIVLCTISGVIITVVTSIVPAIWLVKLNIVESIKFV